MSNLPGIVCNLLKHCAPNPFAGVLSMSMLAFFLVTSVTSLIVRVLTSSGVVLMFPIFTLLRSFGLPGADERIISLSYPWIGAARAAISTERSHPQGEFFSPGLWFSHCAVTNCWCRPFCVGASDKGHIVLCYVRGLSSW